MRLFAFANKRASRIRSIRDGLNFTSNNPRTIMQVYLLRLGLKSAQNQSYFILFSPFCQHFCTLNFHSEKSSNKCKTLLAKHHFIILHNSICVLLVNLHRLPPLFVLLSAYSTLFMPVLPVLPGTFRRRFSIRTSPLGSR